MSIHLTRKEIHLTRKEREVCVLLLRGISRREIARLLVISTRTIEHHIHNIETKFNVKSVVGVILELWKLA